MDTTYTGGPVEPNLTVEEHKDYNYNSSSTNTKKASLKAAGNNALVKGTDYVISYSNNVNAGKAFMTLTCIGKYEGEARIAYKILPADAKGTSISLSSTKYVYSGKANKPSVVVKDKSGNTIDKSN